MVRSNLYSGVWMISMFQIVVWTEKHFMFVILKWFHEFVNLYFVQSLSLFHWIGKTHDQYQMNKIPVGLRNPVWLSWVVDYVECKRSWFSPAECDFFAFLTVLLSKFFESHGRWLCFAIYYAMPLLSWPKFVSFWVYPVLPDYGPFWDLCLNMSHGSAFSEIPKWTAKNSGIWYITMSKIELLHSWSHCCVRDMRGWNFEVAKKSGRPSARPPARAWHLLHEAIVRASLASLRLQSFWSQQFKIVILAMSFFWVIEGNECEECWWYSPAILPPALSFRCVWFPRMKTLVMKMPSVRPIT